MRRNSPSEPPLVFEPEDLEIETTDGRRPAGTAGDRMMVGLAALALLAGLLIAITNALPDNPQSASASATADGSEPGASRTPRPTASPPPQRSVQVVVEPLPSPEPVQQGYAGWVRALEEVKIRNSPSSSSLVLATLRPGDAAWVQRRIAATHLGTSWTSCGAIRAGWTSGWRSAVTTTILQLRPAVCSLTSPRRCGIRARLRWSTSVARASWSPP